MTETDRLWDKIFGNDSIKTLLRDDLAAGRLAHAYILEGPEGSGKRMLARTVCAALAGGRRAVRLILDDLCPDVQTLRPADDRKSIGVDEIRALRASACIMPCDLDFKAYLLEDAGAMTVQAQNALLKLLEEPPQNVYFFLMCESSTALLPTVRSRAPTLRMQVFDREELSDCLRSSDPDCRALAADRPETFAALLDEAGGSIGKAKAYLDPARRDAQNGDTQKQTADFLESVLSGDVRDVYLSCLGLPQKRDELVDFCRRARIALRDMAAIRSMETPPLLFGSEDRLRDIAKRVSLSRILQTEDRLAAAQEALNANVNLQNAKISLASSLCRSCR